MKILFPVLVLTILISSCNNQSKKENILTNTKINSIDNFTWLQGKWSNISNESQLFEIWKKDNDSIYSGISFMLLKNDTTFYETIQLKFIDGNLFYIPTVNNQNDDQPVFFKLISTNNGEFIFENKQHDFPQLIIYSNPEVNILNTRIEGVEEGKFHKEEFILNRSSKFP